MVFKKCRLSSAAEWHVHFLNSCHVLDLKKCRLKIIVCKCTQIVSHIHPPSIFRYKFRLGTFLNTFMEYHVRCLFDKRWCLCDHWFAPPKFVGIHEWAPCHLEPRLLWQKRVWLVWWCKFFSLWLMWFAVFEFLRVWQSEFWIGIGLYMAAFFHAR